MPVPRRRSARVTSTAPRTWPPREDLLVQGESLDVMRAFANGIFEVVYADPPFGTGRDQVRRTVKARAQTRGRAGFGGRRYAVEAVSESRYADDIPDYPEFIRPRLEEIRRLLSPTGTLYLHLDWRQSHRTKLLLDEIFGEECFLNEIVWAYDFGGRSTRRWPSKHDTILVYVKDTERYHFDAAAVDREPYMAPGLVGAEKAARGKLPTDVWWHTIVPTNGGEKTGYPTQKPEGIVRRMVSASSRPGGWCLDPVAGSGTLGAVAQTLGRRFVMIDENPEAISIAASRVGARSRRAATATELAQPVARAGRS